MRVCPLMDHKYRVRVLYISILADSVWNLNRAPNRPKSTSSALLLIINHVLLLPHQEWRIRETENRSGGRTPHNSTTATHGTSARPTATTRRRRRRQRPTAGRAWRLHPCGVNAQMVLSTTDVSTTGSSICLKSVQRPLQHKPIRTCSLSFWAESALAVLFFFLLFIISFHIPSLICTKKNMYDVLLLVGMCVCVCVVGILCAHMKLTSIYCNEMCTIDGRARHGWGFSLHAGLVDGVRHRRRPVCVCVQTTVHVSRLRRRQLIRPGPVNGMRKTHQMAVVVLFTARTYIYIYIYLDKCKTVKTRLRARVCVRIWPTPWPPWRVLAAQQMKFIVARIEFRRMAIKNFSWRQ